MEQPHQQQQQQDIKTVLKLTPSTDIAVVYRDSKNESRCIDYNEFITKSNIIQKEFLNILTRMNNNDDNITDISITTHKNTFPNDQNISKDNTDNSINNTNSNTNNKNNTNNNNNFINTNNTNNTNNSNTNLFYEVEVSCEPTPHLPILVYSIIQTSNLVLKPISCHDYLLHGGIDDDNKNNKSTQLRLLIVTEIEFNKLLQNTRDESRVDFFEKANVKRLDCLPGYVFLSWYSPQKPNSNIFDRISSSVYVIQSSGTTGHPKLIYVPQECIVPNIHDLRYNDDENLIFSVLESSFLMMQSCFFLCLEVLS